MNCGVFTCLWGEYYARDDPAFWEEERVCSFESYTSQIVAVILSDDKWLLKGVVDES